VTPTPTTPPAPAPASGQSNAAPTVTDKVARVLSLIRPAVQADGGDIELVGITPQGIAQIRLHGACVGCPSSTMTLKVGIERNLKNHIPEIRGVEAVS
jgi:Fe-S cluster biogenesis protein NfuA